MKKWWGKNGNICGALVLGLLLSWGTHSLVRAQSGFPAGNTGEPVNISKTVQTRISSFTLLNNLGVSNFGNFSFGDAGGKMTISGSVLDFSNTLGVQLSITNPGDTAKPGTVFYSTSDNCLTVFDGTSSKSLCGSAPASACTCATGVMKCDGDKILQCTGIAGNCWKETTCTAPIISGDFDLEVTSPLCVQQNSTYAYCKQCAPSQKSCLSPSVAIEYTCSEEFLWGSKKGCATGETCTDGVGCVPAPIKPCATNGCASPDIPERCSGSVVDTIMRCEVVNGCFQWVNIPCGSTMNCKKTIVDSVEYGACVPTQNLEPALPE